MDIHVKGIEFVETEDGGYFNEYTRIDKIPDEEVRDNIICTVCGVSAYPECKKTCHNFADEKDNATTHN